MGLLSVDDALTTITNALPLVSRENILMADAAASDVIGRILAEDIYAKLSHPPHDVSAMDGYAVRAEDISSIPVDLHVIGESAAGHPFDGELSSGQAVRIFTGAYCPGNTDTIIIQEDTDLSENCVTVKENATIGKFIRPQGNDFTKGDLIARSGGTLTPRLLALMAAAGITSFSLFKKPKVAIMSTGDELVPPGTTPKDGQIVSSNGVFLKNYLTKMGADVLDLGIIPDQDDALSDAFDQAAQADVIITSGGASVGNHDGVAKAMTEGTTTDLNFWRIAMRPGKPLIFGMINNTPMIGLPGNPVSTGVCAMVFVATALKAMTGQDLSHNWGLDIRSGTLAKDLKPNDKRQDYLRSGLTYDAMGTPILTPFPQQDSGMMHLFTDAEALVIRPPFADAAQAGDTVTYLVIPKDI